MIYESRSKLDTITINAVTSSPPPHVTLNKAANPDIVREHRTAVSILSEPVALTSQIDAAADEIAELISNHTFKFHVDDGNAPVVQFRPVVSR